MGRTVRACPAGARVSADGTNCLAATSTAFVSSFVPKAQVDAATPGRSFAVIVTWAAPTTGTRGTEPVALTADDILGYELSWWPEAGGAPVVVPLPKTPLRYELRIPLAKICVAIRVQGQDDWSAASSAVCIEPRKVRPDQPAQVTVTFGEP